MSLFWDDSFCGRRQLAGLIVSTLQGVADQPSKNSQQKQNASDYPALGEPHLQACPGQGFQSVGGQVLRLP